MSASSVGVVVVGHGDTASRLLAAAQQIVPAGSLAGVIAVDAGDGETPALSDELCDTIAANDRGRGVLLLVDLLGASPCQCAQRESAGHDFVILSGLNLAMLLKLASLDRDALEPREIAKACADSGQRAVKVSEGAQEDVQ